MLTTIYISLIGIAFLVSLSAFTRGAAKHLRLFAVLLGITFIAEMLAVYGLAYIGLATNTPIYNVFVLIEFMVYAWFFQHIIHLPSVSRAITGFYIIFPAFWGWTMYRHGLYWWNSYIIILGSCFTIFLSVSYYYQLIRGPQLSSLRRHTEFWIVTGMLLFYSCQLPYLGMLNFLVENYLSLARDLLVVLRLLNVIMYSLFIYAFLWVAIKK